MSNEYKDWIEDLKNSPMGSVEHNKWLCHQYPWLLPHNRWTGNEVEDYDYSWTELDAMPDGWLKAFGEQICEEIQKVLEKADYVDKYHILQIKEKWGYLHWYCGGIPVEIKDEYRAIIKKYEDLSMRTCIHCGKPATKISVGWISPWCDDCAKEIHDGFMPIEEWFKKQSEPIDFGHPFMVSIEPI